MRWSILLVVILGVAGCSSAPTTASEPEPQQTTSEPAPGQAPVDPSVESAPVASEWLIDTKKTLRGLPPEQAVQLLNDLIQAGVSDIRVTDMVADSQDASFMVANALLLKLPSSEGRRTSVFQKLEQLGVQTPQQGDIITLDLTKLQLQTPASN